MTDLLFYLTVRVHTFVTSWYKPFYESFVCWKGVVLGNEYPKYFWQDICFFHCFNEDFFDWYKDDDFVLSLWEILDK